MNKLKLKHKITLATVGVIGLAVIANIYFNRNPDRNIPTTGNLVAPADGVIMSIENNMIEIFIRLTDVHVQRVPCDCTIVAIDNVDNYNDTFTLNTEFGTILLHRMGGILARSLRSFAKIGDLLKKGQPYGRILLGSHCWITVPPTLNILVKVGDSLIAGETIIA